MKKFILQTVAFCSLALISFLLLLSTADGSTDNFYLRFTTPKQENLILGTSRAAQGLQPSVFRDHLGIDFYNYSFTVAHSPYGSVYFNSIQKKLKENTTDGIFIVTIDPWCISGRTKDPNDSINFGENDLCLANTSIVDMNPNFQYLIKNLSGKYYTVLYRHDSRSFLNNDGWFEVNVAMDSATVARRTEEKIRHYRDDHLGRFSLSKFRVDYLKKTIQFLKAHGSVYLVRLPLHPSMFELELKLMPEFDSLVSAVTPLTNGYLDLTNENNKYRYTDGNHLHKESGKLVSKKIAAWIKDGGSPQELVSDNND